MFRYGIPKSVQDAQAVSGAQAVHLPRIARHPHISYHSGRLGNALTGIIAS